MSAFVSPCAVQRDCYSRLFYWQTYDNMTFLYNTSLSLLDRMVGAEEPYRFFCPAIEFWREFTLCKSLPCCMGPSGSQRHVSRKIPAINICTCFFREMTWKKLSWLQGKFPCKIGSVTRSRIAFENLGPTRVAASSQLGSLPGVSWLTCFCQKMDFHNRAHSEHFWLPI